MRETLVVGSLELVVYSKTGPRVKRIPAIARRGKWYIPVAELPRGSYTLRSRLAEGEREAIERAESELLREVVAQRTELRQNEGLLRRLRTMRGV